MRRILKLQWALWGVAATVLTAGTLAYRVASRPTHFSIDLTPGATASVVVRRVLPDSLRAEMDFARRGADRRPELGNYVTRDDFRSTGRLHFDDPGALVKVDVRVPATGEARTLEAEPASSYGSTIGRLLVPFVDDGDPHRFTWQQADAARLPLAAGRSTLVFTVRNVDPRLVGERVTVVLGAPVTFKTVQDGHGFLAWFIVWPLFAGLLALWALGLWHLRRRRRRTDAGI